MKVEHKKVILVEDNQAEAGLLKIAFSELKIKHQLLHFLDGDDVLTQLPGVPIEEIAYILLDLNMPKVNGFQVLKTFAAHPSWKSLPVIVFSSSINQTDINTCYELGANAYVPKPMDFNNLTDTLRTIHAFWGETNLGAFSSRR
jgi:two-component system, response regulator